MNTHSRNTLKILQLLLRCGMICQEELNVVLEMMQAVPERKTMAVGRLTPQCTEASSSKSRQKALILEFD